MSTIRAGIGHMVHNMQVYPVQTHLRSQFNRSHSLITAFDSGLLVPIWERIAYPGDTLKLDISALARLSAQKAPFMTNILMDVHVWNVPIRLVWPHWLNMQGQQDNPGDSTDYLVPVVNPGVSDSYDFGSIFDHFDYVPGVNNYDATSLLLRSYNLTWNEHYRDENLQERVPVETGDTDDVDNYRLLPRGRRKNYFYGLLPWPQKGEDVLLPLGSQAPVMGVAATGVSLPIGGSSSSIDNHWYELMSNNYSSGNSVLHKAAYGSGNETIARETGLFTDLQHATAATMSQLYMANAVQQILQLDARSGTRYIELILGRWGVRSTDARLQRPEFLGGGTFDLNTSIVPQTSSTDATSPQGNLAAYSTINGTTRTIIHSFEEHCIVFAVASIRPAEYYFQQGLHRDFTKRSRFDFYEPGLANLPEQAVFESEIYLQPKTSSQTTTTTTTTGTTTTTTTTVITNDTILGYQERFAEDKTSYSRIHGYMRSTAPQPLDMWHLGIKYDSAPVLNAQFVEEDMSSALARVLAVTGDNTPEFIANFWFDEIWFKEMPLYSNPSLMRF